jgi:hypothetical protein
MDQQEKRKNPKFVLGGTKLLDFCFSINKNVDYGKTKKGKV